MVGFFRAIVLISVLTAATSARGADLEKFIGHWSCKGNFSNGAPIAAELSIEADTRTRALIVHHDDLPPGGYHSLEVWMPNETGAGLRAASCCEESSLGCTGRAVRRWGSRQRKGERRCCWRGTP
jgi:hypothetical protein